ncbi:MAG: VOC family protein [Planctomycetota bacterium]
MAQPHFGYFCWHDYVSPATAKGSAYYGELLGWKTWDMPLGDTTYTFLKANDDDQSTFGGLEEADGGARSRWRSYVAVEDLDAMVARTAELGGKVVQPPREIPGIGRHALVADPTGAVLALYQGNEPRPAREGMTEAMPCWMELLSQDAKGSVAFLTALLGWTTRTKQVDGGHDYTMLMQGDLGVGGVMQAPTKEIPSHWYPFFMTGDLAAAHERATRLGGTSCMPPTEIGDGMGSFAIVNDPNGAVFGLYAM